jgi:hypothetical protein
MGRPGSRCWSPRLAHGWSSGKFGCRDTLLKFRYVGDDHNCHRMRIIFSLHLKEIDMNFQISAF